MGYKYADNLEIGDTIVISEGNYLNMGFFAGRGRNTIQYYTPSCVVAVWEKAQQKNEKFKIKDCWKGYIKDSKWRIAKVNTPLFGAPEHEEDYKKATEILKEIKFIKQ